MSDRPTESAQAFFRLAQENFRQAAVKADVASPLLHEALGNLQLARGMSDLSVGLRATYMLLDEVKSMLKRQGPAR